MNDRLAFRIFACAVAAAALPVMFGTPSSAAEDVSETRTVSGFDRIQMQGAFTTTITAGVHKTRVVVSGRRDVAARVTTEVRDGTLVIGMRSGNYSGQSPTIAISLPALRGLANEGAGSIRIAGLAGPELQLDNSGSASIVASGRVKRESITLDGTGAIDAKDVDAHDVTVSCNGVGSVRLRASGSLVMNVNGVGEIRYAGTPTHVESHINGIGHIGRL